MCAVFETNVFGVIAVTQVMLPRLREAPAGRIVNVSSSVGSLTLNQDSKNPHRSTFGAYSSSKTALNAVTLTFALDLEATREGQRCVPGLHCDGVHQLPGYAHRPAGSA